MEYVALFKVIQEGGWIAIVAVLGFLIYRLDRRLEKLETKLDILKEDMVSKEEYYRDISGWRTEINRLDDKLEKFFLAVAKGLKDTALVALLRDSRKGDGK